MTPGRAFELAGQGDAFRRLVLGSAHAAANAMAETGQKARVKGAIRDAQDMAEHYQALVFTVLPALMTYRADMSEPELRAWAASIAGAQS